MTLDFDLKLKDISINRSQTIGRFMNGVGIAANSGIKFNIGRQIDRPFGITASINDQPRLSNTPGIMLLDPVPAISVYDKFFKGRPMGRLARTVDGFYDLISPFAA